MNLKDIADMGTQEKSAILMGLCGWELRPYRIGVFRLFDTDGNRIDNLDFPASTGVIGWPNLYKLSYFHLAWRVLNFVYDMDAGFVTEFNSWWKDAHIYRWGAKGASALWLDRILELAIEAGMIAVPEKDHE